MKKRNILLLVLLTIFLFTGCGEKSLMITSNDAKRVNSIDECFESIAETNSNTCVSPQ